MQHQLLAADGDQALSVFDGLPPWAVLLIGVGLIFAAALLMLLNKKLSSGEEDNESLIVTIASWFLGIGGLVALWNSLFS